MALDRPKYSRGANDTDIPPRCPVCEGYGKWHKHNGSLCMVKSCDMPKTICKFCDGTGNDQRV